MTILHENFQRFHISFLQQLMLKESVINECNNSRSHPQQDECHLHPPEIYNAAMALVDIRYTRRGMAAALTQTINNKKLSYHRERESASNVALSHGAKGISIW